MTKIALSLAEELKIDPLQVHAVIKLLDEGNTVPFIARYRKEATGGLDDVQLRCLEERLRYLNELEERRTSILNSIREQDKLTPELETLIHQADTKARLEDLYLPHKPKRRTKAQIAIEAGLEPLADAILIDPKLSPEIVALAYVNAEAGIESTKAALEGARLILMERMSTSADLVGQLRTRLSQAGWLKARVQAGQEEAGAKFKDYFDYSEKLGMIPSHRILAILRGRNEGYLTTSIEIDEPHAPTDAFEQLIAQAFDIRHQDRPADDWLKETVRWAWKIKLKPSLELELMAGLREYGEEQAIQVFANNLRDLLMCSPAGPRATLGLDPGFRTGVKYAVVDATGKVGAYGAIFPHEPRQEWDKSIALLSELCRQQQVDLVSIGNGTASRETDQLVEALIARHPDLKLTKVMVSEAGASVYSASAMASAEFPDMDVSYRGAVSIARRLQDPLAELVKIDPKAIGVGQYQHDVNQVALSRQLDAVVEDCVNAVGVDVNTASVPLLTRVAGLNANLAHNIVAFRDANGAFNSRQALKKVTRLGPKAFEQAAGFLRILKGQHPLDASGVHPEAYPLVEAIAHKHDNAIQTILGNSLFLRSIDPKEFISDNYGLVSIKDILQELEKPGRDPRPEFKTAQFKKGVASLKDVKAGMILEGVVTNVANFGAFVDIGVHQDGLVHISELADRFVSNPREVVKAGDVVTVRVIEVEVQRKRIALSLRLKAATEQRATTPGPTKSTGRMPPQAPAKRSTSDFAAMLSSALKQPAS